MKTCRTIACFLGLLAGTAHAGDFLLMADGYTWHSRPSYTTKAGDETPWAQSRRLSLGTALDDTQRLEVGYGRNSHGKASWSIAYAMESG